MIGLGTLCRWIDRVNPGAVDEDDDAAGGTMEADADLGEQTDPDVGNERTDLADDLSMKTMMQIAWIVDAVGRMDRGANDDGDCLLDVADGTNEPGVSGRWKSLPLLLLLPALLWNFEVMMGMVIGATSAGTAVAYVGLYGNSHTGLAAICDRFGKFCDRIIISLICSFAAIFPFFLPTAILAKPRRIQPSSTSSSAN
ncbi:hypothetical protein ACLOJK_019102 [Asimina triloba]